MILPGGWVRGRGFVLEKRGQAEARKKWQAFKIFLLTIYFIKYKV
jgi:hypothetical protein